MLRRRFVAALTTPLLFAPALFAQKKSYTLKGTVEGVNEKDKKLVVHNEDVPGYMAAMTMSYGVDDANVLKKLKSGDRIQATVYDGDLTLYKIQVVPKTGSK